MTDCFEFEIAPVHPALPGHFPGRPVVPGVVVLDQVMEAVAASHPGRRLQSIPNVKFLRPLLPGRRCRITLEPQGADRMRFRCSCGDDELAVGTLRFAEGAPPP